MGRMNIDLRIDTKTDTKSTGVIKPLLKLGGQKHYIICSSEAEHACWFSPSFRRRRRCLLCPHTLSATFNNPFPGSLSEQLFNSHKTLQTYPLLVLYKEKLPEDSWSLFNIQLCYFLMVLVKFNDSYEPDKVFIFTTGSRIYYNKCVCFCWLSVVRVVLTAVIWVCIYQTQTSVWKMSQIYCHSHTEVCVVERDSVSCSLAPEEAARLVSRSSQPHAIVQHQFVLNVFYYFVLFMYLIRTNNLFKAAAGATDMMWQSVPQLCTSDGHHLTKFSRAPPYVTVSSGHSSVSVYCFT